MCTIQFHYFLEINGFKLSKKEITLLEAGLFLHIYEELTEIIRNQYSNYFGLLKANTEKENIMIENNFIQYIIKDILTTNEYDLQGIAYYTDTPEDVIYDLVLGTHLVPSYTLARKIIDLHRSVRPNLYKQIFSKILFKVQDKIKVDNS